MASTSLKRKSLKNKLRAKSRVEKIDRLKSKPALKNVDVQEIKKSFREGK